MLETWPDWSPDGRYLYFCSSPVLWTDFNKVPPDNYEKVKNNPLLLPVLQHGKLPASGSTLLLYFT